MLIIILLHFHANLFHLFGLQICINLITLNRVFRHICCPRQDVIFSWKWVCDVIIIRGPVDFSKRSQMFPAVVSIDAHPSWSLVLFLTQQFTWLFLTLQSGAFPILFSSSGSKLYGWPPLSDMSVLLFKGSLLKHFVTVRSSEGFFLLPWVHSRSGRVHRRDVVHLRDQGKRHSKIWEKV